MSDKPRHRFCSQELLGDLQEALSLPLHIQGFVPSASGGYRAFGVAAGLWEKVRDVQIAAIPESPPTSASKGIELFEFPQARFHVKFGAGAIGGEKADITVWHRSHSYGDPSTVGHWTRGQQYSGVDDLEEVLDPCHWHTEIYLQVTGVVNPGAATELTLFVQGVQDMNAGADVNVVVPPVTVSISAYSAPPSSILAVGTEDALPAGTKHVLHLDDRGDVWEALEADDDLTTHDLTVARVSPGVELLDDAGRSIGGESLTVWGAGAPVSLLFDYIASMHGVDYSGAGDWIRFTPVNDQDPCVVTLTSAAALAVAPVVPGVSVNIDYDGVGGTTTIAAIIAAVAGTPAAAAMITVSGDAGTLPAAPAGVTWTIDLTRRPTPVVGGERFVRRFSRVFAVNAASGAPAALELLVGRR